MNKYLKITPEGSKDFIFEECTAYTDVCAKIQKVFEDKSFLLAITPALEFFDLFSMEKSGISQESMFKTTDNKGRLLVVRPDSTLPIARMASTRLKNHLTPIRLYYRQAVYRNNPTLTGRANEILQMGIELLGIKGKRADLEVITTAIDSLSATTDNFRIELGHAGFFRALANQLDVDDEKREDIRIAIESKNFTWLNSMLDKLPNSPAEEAIRKLPRLFGGEEVFTQAKNLCTCDEAYEALTYLQDLYHSLSELGLGDKITIDLGLVQRNDYYSGIVFSGYVQGIGDAVVSGGRYDMLLDSFKTPMGAAGFAINIDALAQFLLTKNKYSVSVASVLVCCADGCEIKAINKAKELTANGTKAQFSVIESRVKAEEYAKQRGIDEVIYIDRQS